MMLNKDSAPVAAARPQSRPNHAHVGEVGRVLLSSSMLGYDAALNAAKRHVLVEQKLKAQLAPLLENEVVEEQEAKSSSKKKKRKKKSKASHDKSDVEKLQNEIRMESEKFIKLAADKQSLLVMQLERLRAQNRSLEFDGVNSSALNNASVTSAAPRWLTPKESGYDSDSASVSTTATDDVIASAASRYLKGRAQEKVLSQARDAISRAANLCQLLADPKQPGSTERRDVLIRAFRAITTDVLEPQPDLRKL